jgi:UDPglucose 6-dehydrogenase
VHIAEENGYDFQLLRSVIHSNDQQFDRTAAKVRDAAGGSLQGVTVAVWGLTFKAGTDDLRDSPSLEIVRRLLADGAVIRAYDPTVSGPRPGLPDGIECCSTSLEACTGAAVLAVLTEWPTFAKVRPEEVAALMPGRAVVDGRNLLDRQAWTHAGFRHVGVGR